MCRIRAALGTAVLFVIWLTSAEPADYCTATEEEAIYVSKLLATYNAAAIENTNTAVKAAKLRIAAALTKDKEKKKFLPPAMLFDECARLRAKTSLKASQAAATALADLAFAGGVAAATRTLAKLQTAGISAYNAGTAATKRQPIYPVNTATGLETKLCRPTEASTSPTTKTKAAAAPDWQLVYHIVKPETSAPRANKAATDGKATLCLSNNGTCKDDANNGAFYSVQAGTVFTVADNTHEPKHGHNSPEARKKTIWHTQSAEEAQLTAKLDTDTHTAVAAQTSNVPSCNPWDNTDNQHFLKALATAATGTRDPEKIREAMNKIKPQKITETYGKNANDFQDKIWKRLEDTPITPQNSGVKEDTTLKSISDLDQLLFLEQTLKIAKKDRAAKHVQQTCCKRKRREPRKFSQISRRMQKAQNK
uniref:Variant surface glycoprotein 1369 n=1 Tax=Trypanosoma brucei TaxID=5691 RepID=M4SYC6_9TRYP|nr:variant surface glycoprotein 1369 [Trypanosoma brucei]